VDVDYVYSIYGTYEHGGLDGNYNINSIYHCILSLLISVSRDTFISTPISVIICVKFPKPRTVILCLH
jgi:hypothetical protein